jgi:ketosteroid isomerase-like protein
MPASDLSAPLTVDFAVWVAISDQLQRYADAIDRGDIPAILAIFTPAAVWDYAPGLKRQGHGEIAAFFTERFSVFAQTSHHVGPPVVRANEADGTWESTAYFIATHLLKDGKTYTGYGRYVDVFHNDNATMRIGRRAIIGHVTHGIARTVNTLERVVQ